MSQCNEMRGRTRITISKEGRSDAAPIKYFSSYENIFIITRNNFDGSGITPSYFPALMKWKFWSYPSFHYIDSLLAVLSKLKVTQINFVSRNQLHNTAIAVIIQILA